MNIMDKPVIAHSVPSYLFLTGSWIYGQLINLKRFNPIVITNYIQNMDIFPFQPIYSLNIQHRINKKLLVRLFMLFIGDQLTANKRYRYFIDILKEHRIVLLHSHFGNEGFWDLCLKQKLKIPIVISFYGSDVSKLAKNPLWRHRYRRLFSKGELFLAEGNFMKKSLINLGCPEEKVFIQHLGIDLEKIKFKPRKIGYNGKIKILISGSFREKKGISYAIEAFAKVRQKHKNIELTIIGDSSGIPRDEAEKRKILNTVKKNYLQSLIKTLGYQPYSVFIEELYKHHIFLSPSIHASNGDAEGGAPVSITEASASGMPIISTYHCDIPEIVLDEKSGYLVKEKDVESLAEKLEYLITNPRKWSELGEAGYTHIKNEYNIKKQVKKLENIYTKLI